LFGARMGMGAFPFAVMAPLVCRDHSSVIFLSGVMEVLTMRRVNGGAGEDFGTRLVMMVSLDRSNTKSSRLVMRLCLVKIKIKTDGYMAKTI